MDPAKRPGMALPSLLRTPAFVAAVSSQQPVLCVSLLLPMARLKKISSRLMSGGALPEAFRELIQPEHRLVDLASAHENFFRRDPRVFLHHRRSQPQNAVNRRGQFLRKQMN